jgi:hypothetical protein
MKKTLKLIVVALLLACLAGCCKPVHRGEDIFGK